MTAGQAFGWLLLLAAGTHADEGVASFTRAACARPADDAFFFPHGGPGLRLGRSPDDPFVSNWYSQHLRAMGEPTLSCRGPRGVVYRFLWLRTWGKPVAVRIEKDGGAVLLHVVELDGAGGYQPGKVSRRDTRTLSTGEWQSFSRALAAADVWRMGVDPSHGLDGSQRILEARDRAKYHLVDRWSPKTGAYRELCLLMLKLAGVATGTGKREGLY